MEAIQATMQREMRKLKATVAAQKEQLAALQHPKDSTAPSPPAAVFSKPTSRPPQAPRPATSMLI